VDKIKKRKKTADSVILQKLAYEFRFCDRKDTERKIKQGLRYYQCGPYNQGRVDLLRSLKDQLQQEIGKYGRSRYYLQPTGKFAAMEDFDVDRMISDCRAAYPTVPAAELEWFVPHAIFLYYLR
jgi:hypothetical protein